jgi:glycosyltransferase involved in cell wall biosynthesis
MKIFYLTNGESVHDERFLKKMIEHGYEIFLISYSKDKIPKEIPGLKKVIHKPLVPSFIPFSIYFNYFPFGFLHLKYLIWKYKPDILHAGWVQHYGFISALSGFHPLVIIPWGSDILIEPHKSNIHRMLTKYTLNRADMISVDAEFVKDEIIRISGYPDEKIVVFPQGIDQKMFNKNVDGSGIRKKLGWSDKKILIMARTFKPVYGIEYFLQALTEVVKKVPDVRVLMCGDGPLGDEFKSFVAKNSLREYIHFAGMVANEDLPKYYSAADIYVSSSLSDGTSLALLESMACGLPSVVTDIPAILEWVKNGENGFIVPRKNSKILAEKLIELLRNDEMRREFGRENLKVAKQRANWDDNFMKLVDIYDKLCPQKEVN